MQTSNHLSVVDSLPARVDCKESAEGRTQALQSDSLNKDEFNLRAEMLAMQECMTGLEIRREWTEQQMVSSFGGQIFPGTPDGMFEEWNGSLTCVQVVRVPLTATMTSQQQEEIVYATVLDKVVKSQRWMRATRIMPHEFIIFCWCQGWPDTSGDATQELIERVRKDGWPFALTLMVPEDSSALFPCKFAYPRAGREGGRHSRGRLHKKHYTEDDLSTYVPWDFVSDEDEYEFSLFDDEPELAVECQHELHDDQCAPSRIPSA